MLVGHIVGFADEQWIPARFTADAAEFVLDQFKRAVAVEVAVLEAQPGKQ